MMKFCVWSWVASTICILLHEELVRGMSLTAVRIEGHAILGNSTTLGCQFDLQGEKLYSVKWYKDGEEFFRYLPGGHTHVQVFPMEGVDVDVSRSNETQVYLRSLVLSSTGRYRCEVSAEAPSFQTVSDHGDMLVVALPSEGPKIRGGRPRYQLGDMVKVNCTSGRSKPPAQLMWFINGNQADRAFLRGPFIRSEGNEGLEVTTLGLEFKVESHHFRRGDLKLKCLATIATIYWNSNEESVEGEKPQRSPALEVKETTNRSRADRVLSHRPVLTPTSRASLQCPLPQSAVLSLSLVLLALSLHR